MERRDFMKLTGVAGAGAALAGNAGCLPGLLPRRVSQAEIDKIMAQMDAGLDRVSRYDMIDDFAKRTGRQADVTGDDRALARASLRAMYTSQMFRSLPEEAQVHPAMQERMFGHLVEMDDAVFGMLDRMTSSTKQERTVVRDALRADSSLTETLSQGIDRGMGKLQMSVGKRFQLRQIFSQVGWRMQKHSPTAVIDEYVDKVVKASGQIGSQAELERRISAQIGQDAYWRYQNHLALMFADDPGTGGGSATQAPTAPAPAGPPGPQAPGATVAEMLLANARQAASRRYCETVEIIGKQLAELDPGLYQREYLTDPSITGCRQARAAEKVAIAPGPDCGDAHALANKLAHDKVVGTGGWMLGVALISGVVGAVTVSSGVGVVLLTLGAVLLIGGLIVVAVGAAMADK